MYENSMEMKIWKSVLPVLIYLFINMLVQVVFTIAVTINEFMKLGSGGIMDYFTGYNFSGDIERVVSENGLAVTLISGLITIPVCLVMMKKDEDLKEYTTIKNHLKNIRLKRWYYIVLVGIFASMGIGKAVTILPIDNILGSYEQVQSSFVSNPLILQIGALAFIGPVTEEIVFRGLVYKRIKGYTDSLKGGIISAALFGIYHFNLVQGIYGFVLGILLVYVYEKYKTIAAPVILHVSANIAALVMDYSNISTAINQNIYLKILFMLIETGALAAVLWRLNSIRDIRQ